MNLNGRSTVFSGLGRLSGCVRLDGSSTASFGEEGGRGRRRHWFKGKGLLDEVLKLGLGSAGARSWWMLMVLVVEMW